jgi:hypothetical protein
MTHLSGSRAAIVIAIVLLYTNLPVVAAQRGLVPTATAAIVPALMMIAVLGQLIVLRRRVLVDRTLLALFAFLIVFVLSSFGAVGHAVAISRIGTFVVEGLLLYFLTRNAVRDLADLRAAIKAVVFSATLLAGLTLIQAISGDYERDFMGLAQRSLEHLEERPEAAADEMGDEDRARGPVDEPNRFAQVLLMAAPLAGALALSARTRLGAGVAGLSALVILGGVLVTYSRGAFVTLVGLALLTPFLRLVRPHRLVAALAVCVMLSPFVAPGYARRIASIAGVAALFGQSQVEADGPTRGRTTEMLAALAAYTEHPILGVGPGQYMPYHSVHYQALPEVSIRELAIPRRAHNLFLEIAAESGTLGLAVFLFIPVLLLRDLEGTRRRLLVSHPDLARIAATFALALLAYLGTGMFLHLSYERYYWFLLGLTAAAVGALQGAAVTREETARVSPSSAEPPWVPWTMGGARC